MKARYGYIGKMLFVNLNDGTIQQEELSEDLARNFIGGYGIGARIMYDRMKAGADPLGPDNIFALGTGPLTLAGTVSTCRFTAMGKSPLTGYWGDANSGGNFAIAQRASGYDMIFFEGKSERPVYLLVTNGKPELKDASHLWGKDTIETEAMIREENQGKDYRIVSIGPGGEKCARIAAVINDHGRAAARSGLGAVMGSKNLKAVACMGFQRPGLHDMVKVKELVTAITEDMVNDPSGMIMVLSNTGTPGAMGPHMATHDVPIRNWGGNNVEDFPKELWEKVGYEALEKYIVEKYACEDCKIACGGWLEVPGGKYPLKKTHKPEYETLAAFGPDCLNIDMESMIYANDLCNRYGLDTIGTGSTIALAIECYENGLLTRGDTDGMELTWGNSDVIVELVHKIARREGIGDILAEGGKIAAEKIGKEAEPLAMHVGGELMPMHDPRQAPGWGATYSSDPTPGKHTRGGTMFAEDGHAPGLICEMLGLPNKLDKYNPEGKGKYHAIMAGWQHITNTSGACLFAADGLNFRFVDVMKAITGWDLTPENLVETGHRIAAIMHAFNLKHGFKPSDFQIPPRVCGDPPLTAGKLKDVKIDFEELKRQYYEAMGYDVDTAAIKPETIEKLGLQDVL
ncbi:MAG: aldehyde ferredoxin oxidoreductase family protein [Acidobacteria bacterium]|nr:aldehyde ferredoxin oxidoreductase family protein [Acidobacteriota bacterium]